MNYSDSLIGTLSNSEARQWYIERDRNIPNLIDRTKPLEEQAREAHELRNTYRTQTRDMMRDQAARCMLDKNEPNKTFDEMIDYKRKKYGFTRDQALADIIRTSSLTNAFVDRSLGL